METEAAPMMTTKRALVRRFSFCRKRIMDGLEPTLYARALSCPIHGISCRVLGLNHAKAGKSRSMRLIVIIDEGGWGLRQRVRGREARFAANAKRASSIRMSAFVCIGLLVVTASSNNRRSSSRGGSTPVRSSTDTGSRRDGRSSRDDRDSVRRGRGLAQGARLPADRRGSR